MRADYDLVIIGDSDVARWTALTAARQYARVALVLQHPHEQPSFPWVMQSLADLIADAQLQHLPLPFTTIEAFGQWIDVQGKRRLRFYELNRLSHHGVDVVTTPGQFLETQTRTPIFALSNRQLRSRNYLLALPQAQAYLDLRQFLDQLKTLPPQTPVGIDCQYPWAIAVGQTLNRLGYRVTLIGQDTLLPYEDSDTNFFVQCALEADGLIIHDKTQHDVDNRAIFSPDCNVNLKSLKLERLGIATPQAGTAAPLTVSSTLQTQQSSIYACGAVLGGYSSEKIAQREAAIALQNSLFQAKQQQQYHRWSYRLPLGLGFCRVGLTEQQARRLFSNLEVLTRTMEDAGAPLFCKLIATNSGEVVGIHLVGHAACSTAHSIEQILEHRLSVFQLNQVPLENYLLRDVFQDFAVRWSQIKKTKTRDRNEQYFRAKRQRFS